MFPQKQQVDATSDYSLQRLITDLRSWLAKKDGAKLLTPESAEAIDLGLSVKWANMNIGAEEATDYGDYFAWGETEPKKDGNYHFTNYKWFSPDNGGFYVKYANYIDNKTLLDPDDDAAVMTWGGKWRMPTNEEIVELLDNCYWVWTEDYKNSGVAGYIVYRAKNSKDKGVVTQKDDNSLQYYSYSDCHIFLPATGTQGEDHGIEGDTYSGSYWSKSLLDDDDNMDAFCLCFFDKELDRDTYDRHCGLVVRAVCS